MLTLFRIKKIDVCLHYSSIILFSYTVWACAPLWEVFNKGYYPIEYLISIAFSLALFSNILAHEIAHAIANNKVDIKTESVFFFFIGAGTYSKENFRTPRQEIISASAGLGVSILLAVASLGIYFLVKKIFGATFLNSKIQTFIFFLSYFNFLCVIVNLIPAFPTDGGRIFRALLWLIAKDKLRATSWAVTCSYILITLLGIITFFLNETLSLKFWVLIVIIFTFLGAKIELEMTRTGKSEKEILTNYQKKLPAFLFRKIPEEVPNEILLL